MQDASNPNARYTLKFKTDSGRWFEVIATNDTLFSLTQRCKENGFKPLLEGLQTIFPQPVPPFIKELQEKGKERAEKRRAEADLIKSQEAAA